MASRLSPRELADRLLSGSAGLIAVTALAVSAYQAYLAREQQRMSAWPYVKLLNSGGDSSYAYLVQNVGLGPALVRGMAVSVRGRETRRWDEVGTAVLRVDVTALRAAQRGTSMSNSTVQRGSVLLPGSTTELLRVTGPFAATVRRILNDPAVHIRVCYCSLYQDCWLSDSQEREPAPVRACPDARGREFES